MRSTHLARVVVLVLIAFSSSACGGAASLPTAVPSTAVSTTEVPVEAEPDLSEPEPPAETKPAEGALTDAASWEDGLSYSVLSVKQFKVSQYALEYEKGLVPLEVLVKFTNSGNRLNSADFVTVRLLVGPNDNEAPAFQDPGGTGKGEGWSGKELRAGKSETASFAFMAEPADVADGTVVVVYDRKLAGELRVRGTISK